MKVVILAGGMGSRISEESHLRPKPMVEIGGKPILWHIMKSYHTQGFSDFVICLGYKGRIIKEYFYNYGLYSSDVTFDFSGTQGRQVEFHNSSVEPWRVTLSETGLDTMTGSRLARIRPLVQDGTFMMTYGDGLADVNLKDLLSFHRSHGKIATVTAVQPKGRFGSLDLDAGCSVRSFLEKPPGDGGWINAGYFVFEPKIFDFLDSSRNDLVFEKEPLEDLASAGELMAHRHTGYWQPLDTMRDKLQLETLWDDKSAPWKIW